MISKCLSSDLKDDGILTCLIHPGWVQTDMGGPNAKTSRNESVEGKFFCVLLMFIWCYKSYSVLKYIYNCVRNDESYSEDEPRTQW